MNTAIATAIFIALFVLIFTDRLHRSIAAFFCAGLMVLVGGWLNFYSQDQAIKAIDFNTIGLLFGMMILVIMLEKTGFFQYLAIIAARRTRGNPWKLMVTLATVTTVVSMFLDNVTAVILIAPLTIMVAELIGISPIPLLIAEAILSNVGGVATLVGDPPNIIIGSAAGFSFNDFITHLAPIVVVVYIVILFLLRFLFRRQLAKKPTNLEALMALVPHKAIRDRRTMNKLLLVLLGVIILFFFHGTLHWKASFVALLGAAAALVWVRPDIDALLKQIHWGVLVFFAALFIAVGGLEATGVLESLANGIVSLARNHPQLAGFLLIWAAALLSAVVDNIPFTVAMLPIISHLGTQGIAVNPLWWALALGAGFGGNGTIIGATANVVVVSLSEKTRTPITSRMWNKTGLVVMLASCLVSSLLYLIAYPWFTGPWNR